MLFFFQTDVKLDPSYVLGILDKYMITDYTKVSVSRAQFQARKLILQYWKSEQPPNVQEWINYMGHTLCLDCVIFQHRGNLLNFKKCGITGWPHLTCRLVIGRIL